MYIEYPKALYRKGECTTVEDASGEDSAREEGFTDWAEDHAAMQAPEADEEQDPRAAGDDHIALVTGKRAYRKKVA